MERLPTSGHEIAYRKQTGERVFVACATPFIATLFGAFAAMILPATLRSHPGHSPLENLNFAIFGLLITAFGVGIVSVGIYGMGPEELTLDLITRRYRFRRGFPLLARTQTGPFDDIACVYVKKWQNKSVTRWQILLGWNGRGYRTLAPIGDGPLATRKDVLLKMAKTESEAREQAQTVAVQLGVPFEEGERDTSNSPKRQIQQKWIVGGVIAAIVALMFAMVGLPLALQKQLDIQGQTTPGRVVKQRAGKSDWIYFTYEANGQSLRGKDEVLRDDFERLSVGSSVTVTYLPQYPRTCRIAESNAKRSNLVPLIGYGGLMIIGGIGQAISAYKKRPAR